jgi:hypothetical protein
MKLPGRQLVAMATLYLSLAVPAWAQFTIPSGSSFDVPAGATIDTACIPVEVEGNLNVHSGQFATGSDLNVASTGAVDDGAGIISIGGDLTSTGTFNAGTGTVKFVDGCAGTPAHLVGTLIFQNLTLSSTAGRAFVIPAGSSITVLGTLTLQGAPGQSIQLISSSSSTAVINLGPAATVVRNFASVAGNVQIGASAATSAHAIPTLNQYGVLLLSLLLSCTAVWYRRRQTMPARPGTALRTLTR